MSTLGLSLLVGGFAAGCVALRLLGKETMGSKRRLRAGNAGEKRISMALTALGVPHVDDVTFNFDGYSVQVDHVAAVGDRLIAIETKNLKGLIEAPERGEWTQTVGRDRCKMQNPTEQNTWHCRAIGKNWGVWCNGVVVLAGSGRVVGNWPCGVTRKEHLAAAIASAAERSGVSACLPPSSRAASALAQIARHAERGQGKLKQRHVSRVRAKYGGTKWAEQWGAGAMILAALGYMTW